MVILSKETNTQALSTAVAGSSVYDLLRAEGMNPGANATTLSYLDTAKSFGLLDKWTEVECSDGTKARILKNPADSFELYAREWTTKFNVVVDILNQVKAEGNAEVSNKIVKLFDNLNYVDATLREMYKNAYLTFAATPCSESSQKEKQRMDRVIAAIALSLVGLKVMIEANGTKNIDNLNSEVLKLIEKITNALIMGS
jgi:hypothetical protein